MENIVELIIKSYGVIGLILVSPLVAMKFLWNHNQQLQKDLQAANDKVVEVSNKRTEDAKAIAEKLMEMAGEHAGLTKETNMALDRVGDTLTLIANQDRRRPDRQDQDVPRRRRTDNDE